MWRLRLADGRSLALPRLPARIGSAATADLRLRHDSIEAEHAELVEDGPGALRIRACSASAVVGIDGRRVTEGRLGAGEALVLGRLRFLLVGDDRAASGATDTDEVAGDDASSDEDHDALAARLMAAAGRRPDPARTARRAAAEREAPPPAADATLAPRTGRRLSTRRERQPARRGLLALDLGQLSGGARLALVAALLVACVGLAALIGWLIHLV